MYKSIFIKMAISIMLFSVPLSSPASVTLKTEKVMHAVGVLKGVYQDCTLSEAVAVLQKAASEDAMAYAMNVLGLVYLEGIGIECDTVKALHWLEKAGQHGFSDAYHNLGAVYKEGKSGVKQNFDKAFISFCKGADARSTMCKYDAGFMLYKGLGCRQSYEDAVKLFEEASTKEHVASKYMLGLCYRNGYGVEKDEEKGLQLLHHAADLGFRAAIEESKRAMPENCMDDILVNSNAPNCMLDIKAGLNDTSFLSGDYVGHIVMYDWSGKHVLGEKPVFMSVKKYDSGFTGHFLIGNDSVPFVADVEPHGTLKFKKGSVRMMERYTYSGKVRYKLEKADLDMWDGNIRGNLSLYSLDQREPGRPMYLELYRSGEKKYRSNKNASITVSPNPFETSFEVVFRITRSSPVRIRIFNQSGIMVWHDDFGVLQEGEQKISLTPDIPSGCYVLNISAYGSIFRTILVKK